MDRSEEERIVSLNEALYEEASIEELEERLEMDTCTGYCATNHV